MVVDIHIELIGPSAAQLVIVAMLLVFASVSVVALTRAHRLRRP